MLGLVGGIGEKGPIPVWEVGTVSGAAAELADELSGIAGSLPCFKNGLGLNRKVFASGGTQ